MYIYDTITETVVEFYYRDLNTPSRFIHDTHLHSTLPKTTGVFVFLGTCCYTQTFINSSDHAYSYHNSDLQYIKITARSKGVNHIPLYVILWGPTENNFARDKTLATGFVF